MSVLFAEPTILAGVLAIAAIEVITDFGWALTQRGWTHREAGRQA